MERTLNLGIVAHVDAGKTSLTERLLFAAGVIDEIGSVEDGSTQTDSLALERQRGITIKSAVASFAIGDVAVNLIDTPGHPDFIAEVERALRVLDGAVLVISAVEGVQAQTRVLMRVLRRLGIPTLLFVNKIDRRGASDDRVVRSIREKLTPSVIPMGSVGELGTRGARFVPAAAADAGFTARMLGVLTEHDDGLLAAYVGGEPISYGALHARLAEQTRRVLVHPVFFGSAITGAGVDALTAGIAELLPATEGDAGGPVSGSVFKVERGPAGEKVAYVRMFSGTVRTRDRLPVGRVTAISVFDGGSAVRQPFVAAGQIGKLWGLGDVRIGDAIGAARETDPHYFAPPTLETVVVPARSADRGALHAALTQLTEQDPLINLRLDGTRQEIAVSLYGEVQKEVIEATLADEYGLAVTFSETTTICVERPAGTGAAVEYLGKDGNPFLATAGLRLEPAAVDSGVDFRLDVAVESIPLFVYKQVPYFRAAIQDALRDTFQQGLHGWQVTDCRVVMTHAGYTSPETTAGDFRKLVPLVAMAALRQAGTVVCEPIHRFQLDGPADTLGAVLGAVARLGGAMDTQQVRGPSVALTGFIAAARVHDLERRLPGLTHGEGVLESAFDHYRPVRGAAPTRPRSDHNPLNRKEYLLHVIRRV
ncbi:MAG: ribosomal protection tetracycline resistance protein [Micromonosporaceae bacterium]